MEYGELNNIISVIIGLSIILLGSIAAYLAQKKLFNKNGTK